MSAHLDDTTIWTHQNCTIQSGQIIVEDGTLHAPHSVHREVIDAISEDASQAVYQVVVKPLERTKCWVGARANNKFYMASFDLAAKTTLGAGNFVSQHSLIDLENGTFECRVLFDGDFPDDAVLAVGPLIEDMNEDYDGASGLAALEVLDVFFAEGTEFDPFFSREIEGDEEPDNKSVENNIFSLVSTKPQALRIASRDFDNSKFTAECAIKIESKGEEVPIVQQWNAGNNDRSWRLFLTAEGKPVVELSKDGQSVAKRYESTVELEEGDPALVSFTWDGTGLKMFINDTELTGNNLNRVIDESINGQLHHAGADLEAVSSQNGAPFKHWLWDVPRSLQEITEDAHGLELSGLPGEEENPDPVLPGDFPTTLSEMIQWLAERGIAEGNIRYVDNLSGKDHQNGRSANTPWRSIQKAANELRAGMAVIIRGRGGRFYEQITPKAHGSPGDRIWFVGDPENPPILDSSEQFIAPWEKEGNRWRAPYNKNRKYSREHAYHNNCSGGACRHESVWMSHQLIFKDKQLKRISETNVPGQMAGGTCYFEKGNGSYDQPQFVWCRLPGDADPNEEHIRIGSARKYMFDWSSHNWESFPGGTGTQQIEGRNYLGLVNLHFRFGATIRKRGPLNIRGKGWHVEHCSFSEGNSYGFSITGSNHTIIDCKVINAGQGIFRADYLQNSDGTTRFERCLFDGGNIHMYPEAWEAGQKFTFCGQKGQTEFVECFFRNIHGPALWWDLFNGDKNKQDPSFIIRRCIFEECARNTIFFEHNSYNILVEHCGVWNTRLSTEGKHGQTLAAAVRSQGAGHNIVRNNAFVFNEGKGVYFKAHDTRGDNNNDTIENNVFVNNARSNELDLQRCEYYGGDEPPHNPKPNREWSTSRINGNVFFSDKAAILFFRDNKNGTNKASNDIVEFQRADWTGGSGNQKAPSAGDLVDNFEHRKKFWKTKGNFASKGPKNLKHFEDLPGTSWVVPQ